MFNVQFSVGDEDEEMLCCSVLCCVCNCYWNISKINETSNSGEITLILGNPLNLSK